VSSIVDAPLLADASASLPSAAPLRQVGKPAWDGLAADALEPNGFLLSGFSRPAFEHCGPQLQPSMLTAYSAPDRHLIGLLPVVSASRALRLPVPALIAHQPYSPLTVPLLRNGQGREAAGALIDAARAAGARVLSLPVMTLDGPAFTALGEAMTQQGITPTIHDRHERAAFDATSEAETYLRGGMGSKKLKELRRLEHRLADEGAVAFTVATEPAPVVQSLERFLVLEAAGWKGAGGTGLGQGAGDAAFIRAAATSLSAEGRLEIAELSVGERVIASGIVLRSGDRAFFFKIAYDEAMARYSPGVQLTVALTRHLAADPTIRLVDSTADAGHPMIDHVWRERLPVGDLLIPTRAKDPVAALTIRALAARRHLRGKAKRAFHALRNRMEFRA
jgi:CelD/BcsL family acetyltransferase involved in cellulose biosynthesis